MAYLFGEGLVDEIVSYLQTNLGTKIDAIETQIGDGITVETPDTASYFRRDPDDMRSLNLVPAVFVLVPRTQIVQWRETSARQNHDVFIYVITRANDPETVRKKMYRYARAVWETLVDSQFDAGLTWKMGIESAPEFDFSGTVTRGNMAMGEVLIDLQFEKLETE